MRLDEIRHDYELWGHALSSDPTPQALTRVAELVRINVDEQTPLREAAANVISALRRLTPERLFVLHRASKAESLAPGDLWCPPSRSCLPPPLYCDIHPVRVEPSDWVCISESSEWARFEPDPERQGLSGLLSCLEETWSRLQQRADLDVSCLAARVAMLRTDAQRVLDTLQGCTLVSRRITGGADWTEDEIQFAEQLRGAGASDQKIADALKTRYGREVTRQRVLEKLGSKQANKAREVESRRGLAA